VTDIDDLRIHPHELMEDLARDARAMDLASGRYGEALKTFEGRIDRETGEIILGAKLKWEALMDESLINVTEDMEARAQDPDNKLPATLKARSSIVVQAEARARCKKDHPKEWIAFVEADAELRALEKWLRTRERTANLRQSILSAQKFTGETPGAQDQTFGGRKS
jgi:hypothetical protein